VALARVGSQEIVATLKDVGFYDAIKGEKYWQSEDVRYWFYGHPTKCPTCGVGWISFQPEANIVPHWRGECQPAIEPIVPGLQQ
jgi:hypothetical protein